MNAVNAPTRQLGSQVARDFIKTLPESAWTSGPYESIYERIPALVNIDGGNGMVSNVIEAMFCAVPSARLQS